MTARELALYLLSRHARVRYPGLGILMAAVLSDKRGNFRWNVNSYGETDSRHAEEEALRRVNRWRVVNATLTVVGIRLSSGNLLCSRPCEKRCMPLVRKHRIKTVEYLNFSREWVRERVGFWPRR